MKEDRLKVILCGYHWTGCKALSYLLNAGHEVFVFTHKGPYHIPSLIELCEEKGVAYSTKNISKADLPFKPDIICSVFYRYIIKDWVIDSCDGKIFNLHPSLLPQYRGCSSLTWALINGEQNTGFTYHYINKEVDTGKIILQKKVAIEDFDNQGTLYNRCMFIAMESFNEALLDVINGVKGEEQVGEGSYFKRGCPHDGVIDENWKDPYTKRFIKAMIYPPYANAQFLNKEITTFKEFKELQQRD